MKEMLKKVRRLEVKTRRKVDNIFAGEYHSAFKGQGLEFDEVRPYQYGDDVRAIDWNVSARTGQLFVKVFREEREQTLFVLFDVSGSEDFGPGEENKRLVGTEIASILAFSAMKNNDKVGLATFSDQIEQYYKPQKGRKHVLKLIRGILTTTEQHSRKTNIEAAINFVRHTQKRHGVVILISDFLDTRFEQALIRLNKKHEVILIHLYHANEMFQVGSGTLPIIDMESGTRHWINTGDLGYRRQLNEAFSDIGLKLKGLAKRHNLAYLAINTRKDYFPQLYRFFQEYNRGKKIHSA